MSELLLQNRNETSKNHPKPSKIVEKKFQRKTIYFVIKKFKKIRIFNNRFINQAKQINWALHNVKFYTQWILRIDADEYFTKTLKEAARKRGKQKPQNSFSKHDSLIKRETMTSPCQRTNTVSFLLLPKD